MQKPLDSEAEYNSYSLVASHTGAMTSTSLADLRLLVDESS